MYTRTASFTILALVVLATLLAGCSSPTVTPSPAATATPAATPTAAPTAAPSATPTVAPTAQPTATPAPTATPQPAPQSASVSLQNFAFTPQLVQIATGGSVTWTNMDTITHTVTFSDSSQTLDHGASYTRKFDAPGSYAYHCSIHPSMTGTVQVI